MAEETNPLEELLIDELKDLYSAENQIIKALPKMAKAAASPDLRRAFERHLEETRRHVERLDQIGEQFETRLTGKKCHGMEGLIEEGKEIMSEDLDENALDAGLIGAAQKVEHYEIAAYGTARAHAEMLGPQRGRRDRQEAHAARREHHQRRSGGSVAGLPAYGLQAERDATRYRWRRAFLRTPTWRGFRRKTPPRVDPSTARARTSPGAAPRDSCWCARPGLRAAPLRLWAAD
jgi:ferritin-like metal-binding protein YciE